MHPLVVHWAHVGFDYIGMNTISLADAVSAYGKSAKVKLSHASIAGEPEEQLRGPLEGLVQDLALLSGLPSGAVALIGETSLSHLQIRPDFAVSVNGALVGFIEVKAPGKGSDPRQFSGHDKTQWQKLRSLPNLLYTDGNSFSLFRSGERAAETVSLDGGIETAGAKLTAPGSLVAVLADFLRWNPEPPRNAEQLAHVSARLCRLLRDEVVEQIAEGHIGLQELKNDWRMLLFPSASDEQFADGYAQAVTFGLLMARAFDISLKDDLGIAALHLRKSNSLIGTALNLLTEDENNQRALRTSLGTLRRVLDAVNWRHISKDDPDAWLYFYEKFLEVYDNALRKKTGSYYTPPEVVNAMVRLVDDALKGPLFQRGAGLAAADVTIADPAVGTGTFLLGVLRQIAANVEADQGGGAVKGAIEAAAKRIFGFELQFGPFAVAQLRLLAELRELMGTGRSGRIPSLNLFITDTLGNPYEEDEQLPQTVEAVAKSRRDANKVKRGQPITVVIGNPPYKNQAGGDGGWIEKGSTGRGAALDWWVPPKAWKVFAHTHHLKNLYVYFWRWAVLKVFGSGLFEATGETAEDRHGIICFISAAGFLNGKGFQKMRDDLRRECSDIWVIDCSPEGHQPEIATRIFQGVQQPVCIVLAARQAAKQRNVPARLHYISLPAVERKGKFKALEALSLNSPGWREGPSSWRASFLPELTIDWAVFVSLSEIFAWSGSGVTPHRTWPIAPDRESLEARWNALLKEKNLDQKDRLFQADSDRDIHRKVKTNLGRHQARTNTIALESLPVVDPTRYGFRSFDRQWIIPDHRLLSRARPKLWEGLSERQVFLTAIEHVPPKSGPALTFTELVPDCDHYHGRGGRVYPLWADAKSTSPNVKPALLQLLAETYGIAVSPEDVFAYIAAVMAHRAFTARFADDLVQPGLRLPLTAEAGHFTEAVAVGREVVWLHCYGERFVDEAAGRPKGPPRMAREIEPRIPAEGAIPSAPEPLPDTLRYDASTRRLHVGLGFVENVSPAMWDYEISGKQVVWQWFSYRRRDRSKPIIGDKRPPSPLQSIQPEGWLPEYTTDLLNLLRVLGRLTALEPRQAELLERICSGKLITGEVLAETGVSGGGAEDGAD
jgi:hypothetical protein